MRIRALVATENQMVDGRWLMSQSLGDIYLKGVGAAVTIDFDLKRVVGRVILTAMTPQGVEVEAEVTGDTPPGFLAPAAMCLGDGMPVVRITGVTSFGVTSKPADPTLTQWEKLDA